MQTRLALGAILTALLASALVAACGDDGDGDAPADAADAARSHAAAELAARIMRIGEPIGTIVDSEVGAVVPGLQAALNPDAVAAIGSAVEDGDEQLTLIAETADLTVEEFTALWETDRAGAFARFADGLDAAEDPAAVRDGLFLARLAKLPVHPDGALIGTGRIDRPDGTHSFFLIYDVAGESVAIEEAVGRQLDQSPWQVTGGQSRADLALVRFQSTVTADIQGLAWVQPIASSSLLEAAATSDEDADEAAPTPARSFASVLYLIETQPAVPPDEASFTLPAGRPLPEGFPAPFLLDEGKTVTELIWNSAPGGSTYQMTILTSESAFEVADVYRDRLTLAGWDLTDDQAIGFATVLQFASDDGAVQGSVALDAFADDQERTEIVVRLQASTRAPTN